MNRQAPLVPPPPVASTWGSLAASVPRSCPFHPGCAIAHVRMVAGAGARAPVADVRFACGRIIHVPTASAS